MDLKSVKLLVAGFILFAAVGIAASEASAQLQCFDCHGTRHSQDNRPVDAVFRNPSSGGFPGNHRTHLGPAAVSSSCAKCHPGSDQFTTEHRDGRIRMSPNINSSPLTATYRNVTAIIQTPTPTLGTCANVNCHFERSTPSWGADLFRSPSDCNGTCHASPPAGGSGGAAGSHAKHDQFFPGLSNCKKCHSDHYSEAAPFSHATSAKNRGLVVKASDPAFGSYGRYSGNTRDYLPSQTNNFGKCTNYYCHSSVQGLTDPAVPPVSVCEPPVWGTPFNVGFNAYCGGNNCCHGTSYPHAEDQGMYTYIRPLTTGSHSKHVQYKFTYKGSGYSASCIVCHKDFGNGGSGGSCDNCHGVHSDMGYQNHVRGQIVVSFDPVLTLTSGAGAYTGDAVAGTPYGTCSTIYCHSDGTYVATNVLPAYSPIQWGGGSLTCSSCHGFPPLYTNGSPKANSHQKHSGYSCNKCHYSTTSNGTSITTITQFRSHSNQLYDLTPGAGATFTYSYASSGGTCSNISCHRNNSATWGGTIQCSDCHGTQNLACDACHDSPPATGSHLVHFGGSTSQAVYGATTIAADFSSTSSVYLMNCGNCHPMEHTKHGNGTVDVELRNTNAPTGSIKALNPASAAYINGSTVHTDSRGVSYTNGTCSNVYCHSYNDWTTPGGVSRSMACRTSLPPNLVTTRHYRVVTWGGNLPKDCTGCHANPPRTQYPANDGGSGDSHMTINKYHQEELHSWNMEIGEPLSCTYCHNGTVVQKSKVNRYAIVYNNVTTVYSNYSAVPINNFSKHVNGKNDVAFNVTTPIVYNTSGSPTTMSLSNAAYNPNGKTCSNVACHLGQTNVKWGVPYRWFYTIECDRCHQIAYFCP